MEKAPEMAELLPDGQGLTSLQGRILAFLSRQSRAFWLCLGMALVALLGLADLLTGPELEWSLFYLLPVSMAAWFADRGVGAILSAAGALAWYAADIAAGHAYSSSLIGVWNALVALGFLLIVTSLVASLRHALERERLLARTDFTTGALNPRAFSELLEAEADRCRRYERPFSLAYMDVDDFKVINDSLGHTAGDDLLRRIADTLSGQIRSGDTIARLGGDEFAMLLPETPLEHAVDIMERLRQELHATMRREGSTATLSIGVVSCPRSPGSVDELIRCADDLMYEVKRGGKDDIRYAEWKGEEKRE